MRDKTRVENVAVEQLRQWLRDRKLTHQNLATVVGVGKKAVTDWMSQRSRPDIVRRFIIERLTGVPAIDWLNKAEKEEFEMRKKDIIRLRRSPPVAELSDREKMAGRI